MTHGPFPGKGNAAYLNAGYMNGKGYANAHNTNHDYANNTNNANTNYNNKGIGKGGKTGGKGKGKGGKARRRRWCGADYDPNRGPFVQVQQQRAHAAHDEHTQEDQVEISHEALFQGLKQMGLSDDTISKVKAMVPQSAIIHSDDEAMDTPQEPEPMEEWRELQSLAQRLQNVDKLIVDAEAKVSKAKELYEQAMADRDDHIEKKDEYLDRIAQLHAARRNDNTDAIRDISNKYDNLVSWVKSLQTLTSQGITSVSNDAFGSLMAQAPLYEWQQDNADSMEKEQKEAATQNRRIPSRSETPDTAKRSRGTARQRHRSASRSPVPVDE